MLVLLLGVWCPVLHACMHASAYTRTHAHPHPHTCACARVFARLSKNAVLNRYTYTHTRLCLQTEDFMGQQFDIIHAHDWLAAKALVISALLIPALMSYILPATLPYIISPAARAHVFP